MDELEIAALRAAAASEVSFFSSLEDPRSFEFEDLCLPSANPAASDAVVQLQQEEEADCF